MKENVKISKVFEKERRDFIEFRTSYRMKAECEKCKIKLNEQIIEEVDEFEYLVLIMCKHGSMEGKIQKKA